MNKFFVAYRDNDLYQEYVPKLLKGLEVIDTFVVPADVEADEFQAAGVVALKKAKEAGATAFLHDVTCGDSLNFSETFPYRRRVYLDYLFAGQIDQAYDGKTVAENFVWFARQIVGDKLVSQIFIVIDRIADHTFCGSDFRESYLGKMDRVKWAEEVISKAFPKANVSIVENLKQALESASDPSVLIVADRHCGVKEVMPQEKGGWYDNYNNWPHACMLYILPFETTVHHLMSLGKVDFTFDLDAMRAEINEKLK